MVEIHTGRNGCQWIRDVHEISFFYPAFPLSISVPLVLQQLISFEGLHIEPRAPYEYRKLHTSMHN